MNGFDYNNGALDYRFVFLVNETANKYNIRNNRRDETATSLVLIVAQG